MPETTFHTTFSTSQFLLSRVQNGSESGLRSAVSYRFGFNGKENDNEVKGTGNQQDYGMRIYDPRLGRFLSADPLIVQGQEYPWYSPYQFAGNKPILFIDIDGLEEGAHLVHNNISKLQNQAPAKWASAQGGKYQMQYLNYGKGNDFTRAYTNRSGNEQVSAPTQGNAQSASNGSAPVSGPSATTQFANGVDAGLRGNATDALEAHYDGANSAPQREEEAYAAGGVALAYIIGGGWGAVFQLNRAMRIYRDDGSTPAGGTFDELTGYKAGTGDRIITGVEFLRGLYLFTKSGVTYEGSKSTNDGVQALKEGVGLGGNAQEFENQMDKDE